MSSVEAPAEGVWYPIHLGKTFQTSAGSADSKSLSFPQCYTLHYSFKPSSVDTSQAGCLRHGVSTKPAGPGSNNSNNRVSLQLGNNQPGKPKLEFEGHDEACRELDCVLLFDGKSLRLERLHHSVRNIQLVSRTLSSRPEKPTFLQTQHSRPVSPLPPDVHVGSEAGSASPASFPPTATPPSKRMGQTMPLESATGPDPRPVSGTGSRAGSSTSQAGLPRSPLPGRPSGQDARAAAAPSADATKVDKKKPGRKRVGAEEVQARGESPGARGTDASAGEENTAPGRKRKTASGESSLQNPASSSSPLKPGNMRILGGSSSLAASSGPTLASSGAVPSSTAGRQKPEAPRQAPVGAANESGAIEEGLVEEGEEIVEEEMLIELEEEVDLEIVEEVEIDETEGEVQEGSVGGVGSDGDQVARSHALDSAGDGTSKSVSVGGAQSSGKTGEGDKKPDSAQQSADSSDSSKDESGSDDDSSDSESDEDGEAEDDDSGSDASDDLFD